MNEAVLWDTAEALAAATNHKNATTLHSVRVARYATAVALELGWSKDAVDDLRLGALLHDIGQMAWPADLLAKPQPLSAEDRASIESHTEAGAQMISEWPRLARFEPYILAHQEWIDGTGYPRGLTEAGIPEAVQLLSLADVYEALRHGRSYAGTAPRGHDSVIKAMRLMRGRRWSSYLFDDFVRATHGWS